MQFLKSLSILIKRYGRFAAETVIDFFLVSNELSEKQKLPVAPKRKIVFRRNNETG